MRKTKNGSAFERGMGEGATRHTGLKIFFPNNMSRNEQNQKECIEII
jgi:hypothetical protein